MPRRRSEILIPRLAALAARARIDRGLRKQKGGSQPGSPSERRLLPEAGEDVRAGQVPDGSPAFSIATWNIHSCVGIDARFAPERVATAIRGLDVDVIGLQEVGWHHRGEVGIDQFAYLEQSTAYKAIAGPTKHTRDAHYGNALLTRLPVLDVRTLDLSLPMREPRGGIAAVLEAAGRKVRVLVAHLGLDPWERNAQVTRVLEEAALYPDMPTIFMGDLNEWRTKAPRLRRLDERFQDCAAPRSFHARLPTLRLDRIFVSGDMQLVSFEVVRNALTRRASDHLPVRATIMLKDGPEPAPGS